MSSESTIWTIGHSTRSVEEFIDVISAHDIELVADVRRFPGSRRLPHFSSDALSHSLIENGIHYRWLEPLGGRRRSDASIVNAWRHPAFSAYAEHVKSEEFAEGLMELLMLSQGLKTAIMCAEVLWWRCHRRIISDVLTSLGANVVHIRDRDHSELHKLAAPAQLIDGALTYE
ncbi:MAG TPA: DUF488 domain-containing protein [Gemmatimonadaceae bacterium]